MNSIVIIAFIAIVVLAFLIFTGRLSLDSFKARKNSFPTLKNQLDQTDAPLRTSQSTNGLIGFVDPNPPADQGSYFENILTKDLISEDVIRKRYTDLISQVQVNLPTGTGQGVQTKTITLQDALGLFNVKDTSAFTKTLTDGTLKLVQDPTSGLIGVSLTQETVNRAKTDPQLQQALGLVQSKAYVGTS